MAKRILILHGWESNSREHWFLEEKERLERLGHQVVVPDMPDTFHPKKEEWVKVIEDFQPDENSIIVGHSLGGTATLRYLEKANKLVGKAILIATPIRQLDKDYDFTPIANFFEPDFDWQKIQQNCREFIIINQRNDDWIPLQHGKDLASYVGGELEIVEGTNHFDTIDFDLFEKYVLDKEERTENRFSSLFVFNKEDRILVMIDAANLESAVKDLGWWIDYLKLKDLFPKENLVEIRDYCVYHNTENQNKFFTFLKCNSFTLITKPLKLIKAEDIAKGDVRKANFDVEIAVDAMEMKNEFDILVLFSGDSDFDYLLKKLKAKGKTSVVISSKHHISKELIESSDKYIDLKKLKKLIKRDK